MIELILLWSGGAVILIWGIAHIVPARAVVAGFGDLSYDNRKIILMEWVAEGLALSFFGRAGSVCGRKRLAVFPGSDFSVSAGCGDAAGYGCLDTLNGCEN